MINKQTQDQAWRCISAELRKTAQLYYDLEPESEYDKGYNAALKLFFGKHNLISDAEPEEVISVSRKRVQELFEEYKNMITPATGPVDKAAYGGVLLALQALFGSKCLPDETREKREKREIKREDLSEPPQTNDNMEEKEHRNLSQETANCDKEEEKELNLCEILKGHEGEKFIDFINGECTLITLDEEVTHDIVFARVSDGERFSYTDPYLTFYPSGMANLYPFTRCIFHDAKTSWETWLEEQKPKRWRAKGCEEYWFFDRTYKPYSQEESDDLEDDIMYDSYNYFRTKELAQQAAEAVKATLEQFHKDHQQ